LEVLGYGCSAITFLPAWLKLTVSDTSATLGGVNAACDPSDEPDDEGLGSRHSLEIFATAQRYLASVDFSAMHAAYSAYRSLERADAVVEAIATQTAIVKDFARSVDFSYLLNAYDAIREAGLTAQDAIREAGLTAQDIAAQPLFRAFTAWYPSLGIAPPDYFARHATSHAVGHAGVFTPTAALVAVMLATSLTVQYAAGDRRDDDGPLSSELELA
jgi:hypothetical protein